jgi:3-phenylpropionate/trans-cinnamate dioxygenase ferredoxin subunit
LAESKDFQRIATTGEVAPGELKQFELDGRPVGLCNIDGEFYAFEDICTHQFAHLSDGEFDGEKEVKCPLHGARFDVRSGEAKSLPAVKSLPTHEIKVEDGEIYVALNPKQVKVGGRRRR